MNLLIFRKTDKGKTLFLKQKLMESKKLINFSEVSIVLTGNKNTIRANRNNIQYSSAIEELVLYLDGWISRNSVSKEGNVTIKTKT